MNEQDLRVRLDRAAGRIHVGEVPLPAITARGRRRTASRLMAASLAGLVAISGIVWAGVTLSRTGIEAADPAPAHGPVEHFDMGGRPIRPISVGYGAAWFIVDGGPNALARIDLESGRVERVPIAGDAAYVTVGAQSVWVAACAELDIGGCEGPSVVRIDPASREVIASIPLSGYVVSITFGAGSVWVSAFGDGAHVLRIDPSSNRIIADIDDGSCCRDIVYGEGAVWGVGTRRPKARDLARIDPSTERVTYSDIVRRTFDAGSSLVAAGEGRVWVATRGAIAAIDPHSGELVGTADMRAGGWFAPGAGAVWIAHAHRSPSCIELVRIDAQDVEAEVVGVFPLEGDRHPGFGLGVGPQTSVGVGEGSVWIAIDETWEVIRVDLAALSLGPMIDPSCDPSVRS